MERTETYVYMYVCLAVTLYSEGVSSTANTVLSIYLNYISVKLFLITVVAVCFFYNHHRFSLSPLSFVLHELN